MNEINNRMERRDMLRLSGQSGLLLAAVGIVGLTKRAEALATWQMSQIVSAAFSKIGTPYDQLDCSALTQWCYKQAGISIPRNSRDQFGACHLCVDPRWYAGALLFFQNTDPEHYPPGVITHVAISCGDSSMVSSNSIPAPGKVARVSWWNNSYWRPKLVTAAVP